MLCLELLVCAQMTGSFEKTTPMPQPAAKSQAALEEFVEGKWIRYYIGHPSPWIYLVRTCLVVGRHVSRCCQIRRGSLRTADDLRDAIKELFERLLMQHCVYYVQGMQGKATESYVMWCLPNRQVDKYLQVLLASTQSGAVESAEQLRALTPQVVHFC